MTLPAINEENPTTREILAIFAPSTFPKDKLGVASNEDVMATKSSGRDVPMARINAERAKTPVFVCLDILLSATTTKSALLIKRRENNNIIKISAGIILN